MKTFLKYALVAGGIFGVVFLAKKYLVKSDGGADELNATGCPRPCNIGDQQTNDCRCISPPKQGGPSFGSGSMYKTRPGAVGVMVKPVF